MATRVYVGDISIETTKEDLEAIFIKMGRLRDVWVAHNPPGFAFVDFIDAVDAARACRKLNGTVICGAHAVVQIAKKQENGYGPPHPRSQRPFQNRGRYRSSASPQPQGYNQQRGPPGPRRSSPHRQASPQLRPRRRGYTPLSPGRSPPRSSRRAVSPSPPPASRYPPMQSQQHGMLPPGYDYGKLYEIYARAARDEFERFRHEYEARLKRRSGSRSPPPTSSRRPQEVSDRRLKEDALFQSGRRSPSPAARLHDAMRSGRRQQSHALQPPSQHDLGYAPRRGTSPGDRRRSRSRSPHTTTAQRSQRVPTGRPRSPANPSRPRSPPVNVRRPASPPPAASRRPLSPPNSSVRTRSPRSSVDKSSRAGRASPGGQRALQASSAPRPMSSSRRSRSASLPKAYRSNRLEALGSGDAGSRGAGRVV